MKDILKDIRKHVAAGEVTAAEKLLPGAYQAIDKAAKRGVIAANTAGRRKALIARLVSKKA